jgi:hypothetical protein
MFAAIVMFVLSILIVASYFFLASDCYFHEDKASVPVDGKVVGRRKEGNLISYRIEYTDVDGNTHRTWSQCFRNEGWMMDEGATTPIRYLTFKVGPCQVRTIRFVNNPHERAVEEYQIFLRFGIIFLTIAVILLSIYLLAR